MDTKEYVSQLIQRARTAQQEFETYSQQQVDACVRAIGKAIYDHADPLAKQAAEETGMGLYEDKIIKNAGKAKAVWHALKHEKSRGIIAYNNALGLVEIAKPIGVVGAVAPTTNPNTTPMHNAMIALKGGNAIIICPHPRAKKSGKATVDLMRAALQELGAPADLIQIVEEPTMESSSLVMSMTDACISTGGPAMVKVAYSSGKPAFGVGAGNVQCIVDRDVALSEVVPKVVRGRTYDNGVLCTCEQCVICPREKMEELVTLLQKNGALYVSEHDELDAFRKVTFPNGAINKDFVGQSAIKIGKLAGLPVTADSKLIAVKAEGYGAAELFTKEKLCPILAVCAYDTWEEAVEIAKANLEIEGKGHSCSLHSNNKQHIEFAAESICVSRFAVNQIGSSALGGAMNNGLNPTSTLGCGTWGNNSISENLWYKHLINVSRVAYVIDDAVIPTDEDIWNEK